MTIEQQVARHYGSKDLEANILAALAAAGKDMAHLSIDDLAGLDEFHLGWREQTARLASDLGLSAGQHVLDIGCGIGGPARYFAARHQCRVTGLDLTPEFVAAARMLTERCDLAGKASFEVGSALAMPFAAGGFDAACLIHVGMNIADKPALFAEVRRILRPGGRFAVYDVMAMGDADLTYPMPWSALPATSFVAKPAAYRQWLENAGFVLEVEHNRRDSVLEQVKIMRARAAAEGPPPLGLHVIMGPQAKIRLQNVMAALEQGHIAPVEMILRAAEIGR
ncbi:class I SAM-dependent methyltransferase [Dongia rigui]|uniref:Class I SAM-dependent methyltransferase n=1 Tax=Dongia rigui TaxID=940149 RepID=A0ABU5E080_9PROT|nr:class I SAM-dependent methyltransferase [Dongia rigui]MDY0872677.1 class I SAM-dependent methyltransferase [Dongia rigui]